MLCEGQVGEQLLCKPDISLLPNSSFLRRLAEEEWSISSQTEKLNKTKQGVPSPLSVMQSLGRLRNISFCKKIGKKKKSTVTGLENEPSSICGIYKQQRDILHSMHIYFDVVLCGQQGIKSNCTTDIYTTAASLLSGKEERFEGGYNYDFAHSDVPLHY